jgi:uncharacterized RDD family membrane protein YckC
MRIGLLALMTLLVAPAARAQGVDIRLDVSNPAVRVFQNYTLRSSENARQVVVIGGDATIAGHVDQDVVVVLGKAQLSSTASIDGSFVVVGGSAVIADGARVRGDIVVVGNLEAPAAFQPGGQQVSVSALGLDERLRGLVPWFTRGLLLMRPIVPGLWWVWVIAGVFFLVNLLINVVLDAPVTSCTVALRTTPLSAFLTGLLVLLLIGPASVLLAVSVIGIAVIPFLNLAVLLAALIGRVAFARWLGMNVLHQTDLQHRGESMRSFLVGSAIMCLTYMIPVLGFVTWCLAGVFGLGAATQAFFRAYRQERPKDRPRPPRPAPPAPEPPAAVNRPPEGGRYEAAAVNLPPEGRSYETAAVNLPPEGGSYETAAVNLPPEGGRYKTAERSYQTAERGSDDSGDEKSRSFRLQAEEPVVAQAPAVIKTSDLLSCPRATFADRLAAFALDFILVATVAGVLGFDSGFDRSPSFERGLLLVGLVYHVGFWTWRATTVGGIIMQLRVVRSDGAPLGFGEAFVRGLAGIFSLLVVGLGFLWILRDPERQAWHDRIAGTYVVKVPRNWPI